MTVVLVDYGSGNLRSLRAAVERAGSDVVVSDDPETVAGARRLMVPGQGAAGPTMATLRRTGLEKAIREAIGQGAYLLGVCVGLQLLFDASAEDDATCLGLLPGRVERLEGTARLPHMGWNDVEPVGPPHPLADGLPACAYFAHSYRRPRRRPRGRGRDRGRRRAVHVGGRRRAGRRRAVPPRALVRRRAADAARLPAVERCCVGASSPVSTCRAAGS